MEVIEKSCVQKTYEKSLSRNAHLSRDSETSFHCINNISFLDINS
jgi:hypothetical protein